MTQNGCSLKPGSACMLYKPCDGNKFYNVPQLSCKDVVSFPLRSQSPHRTLVSSFSKGMKHLCHSYASSPFSRGEPGGLPHIMPMSLRRVEPRGLPRSIPTVPRRGGPGGLTEALPQLPRRNQLYYSARASKVISYSHRYQATTEKPKWWWRTLACLPYVVPLHAPWMNAETVYQMHPFLENFEFLTYPFLRAYVKLPSWVLMASVTAVYLGVVRRKECPHFFRFHVVMGILLESTMHVIGTVSSWMPCEVFWGKVGILFWSAVAFAYLFTVVECMRCAIAGNYPDVPVLSDSALTHIPYR